MRSGWKRGSQKNNETSNCMVWCASMWVCVKVFSYKGIVSLDRSDAVLVALKSRLHPTHYYGMAFAGIIEQCSVIKSILYF